MVSRGSKGCVAKSGEQQPGCTAEQACMHASQQQVPRGDWPEVDKAHLLPDHTRCWHAPPQTCPAADGSRALGAASRVAVVDTVGAGDLFTSGFLFGLLKGASLQARFCCCCCCCCCCCLLCCWWQVAPCCTTCHRRLLPGQDRRAECYMPATAPTICAGVCLLWLHRWHGSSQDGRSRARARCSAAAMCRHCRHSSGRPS